MEFCCCAQKSNILIPLYKRYIIKLRQERKKKKKMTKKRQENKRKLLFNFLSTIRGSTEFSGMMFSVLYTHAVCHKIKENGKWKTTRVMGTLCVYNCHFLHTFSFLFFSLLCIVLSHLTPYCLISNFLSFNLTHTNHISLHSHCGSHTESQICEPFFWWFYSFIAHFIFFIVIASIFKYCLISLISKKNSHNK